MILTNGDPGWLIRSGFRRKLLEVLFDGRAEADADVAAGAKTFAEQLAAPGLIGFAFVVSASPSRSLILRDAQHEYRFTAQ